MACNSSPGGEFSVRVYADENESAVPERGSWVFDLLRKMLENDEFSDLEFQSKEGSIVKASKKVLASASPVICLALQLNKTRLFQTERWSEAAIHQVLAYLYLGQADLSLGIAVDVAQMACELGLERLQIQALAFMKFNLKKFIDEETFSIDSETYMTEFSAEMRKQKDCINNNQVIFQRILVKFHLQNQMTRSTRTGLFIWQQGGNLKLQWPIYTSDPQCSMLSYSRVETPELTCELNDWITATVNDNEIFLLATRSIKETHFYRAKLVAGGDQKIIWTKHPKIAQEELRYPVIFNGMLYSIGYGKANSRWCYRLSLNDSSADWQSFKLDQVNHCFTPCHVMPLDGRDQVVCPCARRESDKIIIRIFALDNSTTRPNLIKEAQFNPLLSPRSSLVASKTLYLFSWPIHLFEFNSLTMEITQFMMVDGPKPSLFFPLTSLKVDQDFAVVLSHSRSNDLNAPGVAWSFCRKTRTWERLTDDQIKINRQF